VKNVLKQVGVKGLRALAGQNTALERFLEEQYAAVRSRIDRKLVGDNFTLTWSGARGENPIGIYMKGSCDLASIFACTPMIHEVLDGTCCISREGLISDARSDLLLQAVDGVPPEQVAPVVEKLDLPPFYFEPRFLEPSFRVPGVEIEFPKKVVILSIAADVVRTLYRHREHGFLVDPGGWWLNRSLGSVLPDLQVTKWFQQSFESVGRIPLGEFVANFTRVVKLIQARVGAPILVFNMLTVEPGNPTHNYQFVRKPHWLRRREFYLALVELSRSLAFHIVDVDRILKTVGILETQVDFGHFPMQAYRPIGEEAFRILRELGVF
jgi:hypothetical protein